MISQIIPFITSPLLSRIYSPEMFSVFALFLSTVNILDVFATLKYDLAVMVAQDGDEAADALWLCIGISLALSIAVLCATPLAIWLFPSFFGEQSRWLYLVPVSVFFTSLFSTLSYYNLRQNQIAHITRANIVRALCASAVQITLGLLGFGAVGLLLGQAVSYLLGSIMLLFGTAAHIPRPSRQTIKAAAKRHREFPLFTLPGTLATTLSYNLVSYFLKAFFVPAQLGYYSLVNQVLSMPLTVISGAVGNVFLKKSAEEANEKQLNARTFDVITRTLFFLSVPIFTVLFIFATPILRIFLGEQWVPAAGMVRALIPMFFARFVVTPVTSSAIVAGRQAAAMIWQLSLLAASLIPALIQLMQPLSINRYLSLLSALLAVSYGVFYLYCRRLLKSKMPPANR